jgi:hypothetical protein|tara:strand:- start:22 stop:327 length:306 start_codon:yes stop_codon:yes gene_type:complete
MPRFEMNLMITEKSGERVETIEYEIVCFVNNPADFNEVESSANLVINDHLEGAKNIVLFGTAVVEIKGKEVFNISFRNKDADQDEINSIINLCVTGEGTIH